jgi:hypothetical protein
MTMANVRITVGRKLFAGGFKLGMPVLWQIQSGLRRHRFAEGDKAPEKAARADQP